MTERFGIMLSVFLHLMILVSCRLSFSTIPLTPKPGFIFLGPLLSPEDLIVKLPAIRTRFTVLGREETETPFYNTSRIRDRFSLTISHDKNNYNRQVQLPDKRVFKTTFLNDDEAARQREKLLRELGLTPRIPPRVPLNISY